MEPTGISSSFAAHGKFFARGNHKFFFKAVRLEAAELKTFHDRLELRARLEQLKDNHTTGSNP